MPRSERKSSGWVLALVAIAGAFACFGGGPAPGPPIYKYRVVNRYPHDATGYTQGFLYSDGFLYESTGHYGESTLKKMVLETGKAKRKIDIPEQYFAEGLVLWDDRLIMLTWKEHTAFVYDPDTFAKIKEFQYEGEGWGITHDGTDLIFSDGTDEIRFLDPATFEEKRRIKVTAGDQRVVKLNELEYIDGEIWANVWESNYIARIDPTTGEIRSWLNLTGILGDYRVADPRGDVLNGIAHDPATGRIFVTGKHWPTVFEIEVGAEESN